MIASRTTSFVQFQDDGPDDPRQRSDPGPNVGLFVTLDNSHDPSTHDEENTAAVFRRRRLHYYGCHVLLDCSD